MSSDKNIAAVDVLAQMIGSTTRALNSQVDNVLAETINFLRDSERELQTLCKRITIARTEITRTRDEWQGPEQAKPSIEAPQKEKVI
jgi:hypothetical protein